MLDMAIILVVVIVVVVVIVAAAIKMRNGNKRFCPQCGLVWREGAMACMSCKFSPYLPPQHVAIDTSREEFTPKVYGSFEGDMRDPWVRRNF